MLAVMDFRAGNQAAFAALFTQPLSKSESIAGDQLYADQLALIADGMSDTLERPAAEELAKLFHSAQRRYPFDPRIGLAIARTQLACGDVRSARSQLQRASNLSRSQLPGFTAPQLRTLGKSADQLLAANPAP
jgi:hypothetical protein